jgi:NAD(P)-dependent dehydrogenase (short-subunit alcohol dehydrogenase family)
VLVEAFLKEGASRVYAAEYNAGDLNLPAVIPIHLDVSDLSSAQSVAAQCSDVTILINDARAEIVASSTAWHEVSDCARARMETNFWGIWNVSRAFSPVLAKNGGGALVNVVSAFGWSSIEESVTSCASKAAAWALINRLRKELKKQTILVAGVHVASVDNDMMVCLRVPEIPLSQIARSIIDGIAYDQFEIVVSDATASSAVKLDQPSHRWS